MHAKILLTILLFSIPHNGWSYSPPPPINRSGQTLDIPTLIRQMRINISDLKNEVGNHETEIRMFEERFHNQENSNEQMRHQLSEDFQSQKDFSRATLVNLQTKFDNLTNRVAHAETQIDSLTQGFSRLMEDLRQNVAQANDGISVLKEQKQMLNDIDLQVNAQNQHIANLESALQTVMELMQPKEISSSPQINESRTYKVQPGDTLEKIAKSNKTTIQQLKDCNQLTNDRINTGKTLKIPL